MKGSHFLIHEPILVGSCSKSNTLYAAEWQGDCHSASEQAREHDHLAVQFYGICQSRKRVGIDQKRYTQSVLALVPRKRHARCRDIRCARTSFTFASNPHLRWSTAPKHSSPPTPLTSKDPEKSMSQYGLMSWRLALINSSAPMTQIGSMSVQVCIPISALDEYDRCKNGCCCTTHISPQRCRYRCSEKTPRWPQ